MPNTHKAILLAETMISESGLREAMELIGARDWMPVPRPSDAEILTEFMGRLCYKSFIPGLNPNVTKVREGNREYLGNVLKQKHGSVFEHASVTFLLLNVSRILTHELVRHRAGTAYSQESQRFVRLDDFQIYVPDLTPALQELFMHNYRGPGTETQGGLPTSLWIQDKQMEFVKMAGDIQTYTKGLVAEYLKNIGLDNAGVSFHVKKQLTSALRRLLPGGVNTNIGVTANHRTWRHILANRTAPGAEVEIVEVMNDVGIQLQHRYPNIYQDMVSDSMQLKFEFEKI